MPRTNRLVASLLASTLALATLPSAHAQTAPPQSAPLPQAPPVSAPAAQPPPPYVTPAPAPQQAYPQGSYPQPAYPAQQAYPASPPQGTAQPGMQAAQPGWRAPPPAQPSKGLMITGISIFSASYLVAMLVGGALLDGNEDDDGYNGDCKHCKDVAPYLFIPLAGPFVAMSQTPNDGGLIVLGMVEMVGAALTIGGIVRYQNTKRAASFSGYSLELDQRRSLTFDVGTSPRMTGPRATLRF